MPIPKKIHYCWFGKNPKPKLAEKCIASWKKYCPDYEITEWNEDNFDISQAPLYVRQAYDAKKWAFVTDYVRLYAMVGQGGIYMDTDVEVVKPLDPFLKHSAFSGFEDARRIPTGIMACQPGFLLFEQLLHYYDDASFLNEDGNLNMTTNVDIITGMCLERGFVPNNKFQELEGFAIYPRDVFCPVDNVTMKLHRTPDTHTIHWFAGSWFSPEQKKAQRQQIWDAKIFAISRMPNKVGKAVFGEKRYFKIRDSIKGIFQKKH